MKKYAYLFILAGAVVVILLHNKFGADESPEGPPSILPADTSAPEAGEAPSKTKAPPEPIDPATVGTIWGVVKFEGTLPEREKVSMAGYADCIRQHPEKPLSETVLVRDGRLQNVVVQVRKGLEGRRFDPPKAVAVLDQVGCIYTPHVVALQVGQGLQIKNSDPLLHNIHGVSKFGQDFNDAMSTQGDVKAKTFQFPEILPVKCDIHPWMRSYVAVSPHPFIAVTSEEGGFEIGGLPPGKYTLRAWHEALGQQDLEVTLSPTETKEISFFFRKN